MKTKHIVLDVFLYPGVGGRMCVLIRNWKTRRKELNPGDWLLVVNPDGSSARGKIVEITKGLSDKEVGLTLTGLTRQTLQRGATLTKWHSTIHYPNEDTG